MTAPNTVQPAVNDTTETRLRKGMIVTVLLLTLGIIAGFIVASTSKSNNDATADGLTAQVQQAQQHLFVDPAKVPADYCLKILGSSHIMTLKDGTITPVFDAGSTHSVGNGPGYRLWSDSVNTPLTQQTTAGEQAVVCHEPDEAALLMNSWGAGVIGNKTVAQTNTWMAAQGSPAAATTWAQNCLTDVVATHLACAKTMSYMAYMLGLFHNNGVHLTTSVWNVHVTAPVVGRVPTFGLNRKQEHAYFMVLSFTEKTGGCWLKYGINVGVSSPNGGDQRPAGLSCVPPKVPTKPGKPSKPTSHAPSKPGTQTPSTPTHSKSTPPTHIRSTTPHTKPPTTPPTSTKPPTTPPTSTPPSTTPPASCPPGTFGTPGDCTAKNGAPSAQPTAASSGTGTDAPPADQPTTVVSGTTQNNSCSITVRDPNTGLCPPGS